MPIVARRQRRARRRHRRDLQGLPRHSGLLQREPGLSRAEARRPERRLHRGRAAGLSPRHARSRTMQAQASSLSDQDIADVAAFFATSPARPSAAARRRRPSRSRPAARVPPPARRATAPKASPRRRNGRTSRASTRTYLLQALGQYKSGSRADSVMNLLIGPLDETTIEELAGVLLVAAAPARHEARRRHARRARAVLTAAAQAYLPRMPPAEASRLERRESPPAWPRVRLRPRLSRRAARSRASSTCC